MNSPSIEIVSITFLAGQEIMHIRPSPPPSPSGHCSLARITVRATMIERCSLHISHSQVAVFPFSLRWLRSKALLRFRFRRGLSIANTLSVAILSPGPRPLVTKSAFPSWMVLMCLFRLYACEALYSQRGHWYRFSILWTTLTCLASGPDAEHR